MRRFTRLLLFFTLLPNPILQASLAPEAILQNTKKPEVGTTWEIPFIQERTFSFRKRDSRFEGTLLLDGNGTVCVKYSSPFERCIVITQDGQYILDESGQQHLLPESAADWTSLIKQTLTGPVLDLSELWEVSTAEDTHTLSPSNTNAQSPEGLELTIQNQRITRIRFIKGNATHRFELKEPATINFASVEAYLNELYQQ